MKPTIAQIVSLLNSPIVAQQIGTVTVDQFREMQLKYPGIGLSKDPRRNMNELAVILAAELAETILRLGPADAT